MQELQPRFLLTHVGLALALSPSECSLLVSQGFDWQDRVSLLCSGIMQGPLLVALETRLHDHVARYLSEIPRC